jgi:UDP-glucose 4-epimerase
VLQVIDLVCEIAERRDIEAKVIDRRAGDPAFLCADVKLINDTLGFSAKYSLRESITSLFNDAE